MPRLLICSFYLFITVVSFAQSTKTRPDTVYVNRSASLLIVFDVDVKMLDIGTTEYGGMLDGNTVLLKALKSNPQPTSLFIKYANGFYHGTIAFSDKKFKPMLNISVSEVQETTELNESRTITSASPSLDIQLINRRIGYLEAAKQRIKSIGKEENKLIFYISEIMKDDKYFYFKVNLENKSKIDYEIEVMDFSFSSPINSDLIAGGLEMIPAKVVADNGVKSVRVKTEGSLIYCIESQVMGENSKIIVTLRERNGNRKFQLDVPVKELKNAKPF